MNILGIVYSQFSASLSREFIVHPSLYIVDPEVPGHSKVFAEATKSLRGRDALLKAAKFLAMTVFDSRSSAELRELRGKVREAFHKQE